MIKKKTPFLVGLFVIIGTLLGTSAIVWIGASKYFKKGTTYVTYFDESVQGLQVDSKVKYRGVEVGWVKSIDVAPDSRLIEVVMKIDFEGNLTEKNIARLEPAGLTGMVFIDLDNAKPEDHKRTPRLTFEPDYPVIPSVPSDIQRIMTNINEISENIKKIDFDGISRQVKSTIKAVELLVNNQQMKNIMINLDATSESLAKISEKLKNITGDDSIKEIVTEAKNTLKNTSTILNKMAKEVDSLNIAEAAEKTNRFLDDIKKRSNTITIETQRTIENIRRASEALEELTERLKDNPSDIIFSEPPPKDVVN
ncbi:MAG TPA: MlaD family protein [Syntrophorhabdaceae bacterium]|nr:MlaD family protein [Syntrophorhabdaceae bacterium]HOL05377.1 MlaD family protein [Syntrophorhabdaceae bacterium]HOT41557.1 MlaD family protein [Syntrophorhabdaceae bacterium]HPC65855.1 MlaD family protein [Syntrophorhabdaceae bacterium]HPP41697.1 MlaD family protein [Syntrophorhabdaceae bacterium]